MIVLATVTDPQGFGHNVVFRAVGVRRERGVESWDSVLSPGKPRSRLLKQGAFLIRALLEQSSTIHIVRDTLDQLVQWQRTLDVLELVQDLDLSCDLGGKTACDYFARALNEGSEEVRAAAREQLRIRAWRAPNELVALLRATKSWLPAQGEQPSQAATAIADVVTETFEARLDRDSKDGAYEAHPGILNLVGSLQGDFISLALEWMFHPYMREYFGGLLMVHETFLIDKWAIPPGLRSRALGDSPEMNLNYLVNCLGGLLSGLAGAASAFGKLPPPLFPAMIVVEWALAKGPTGALEGVGKAERKALSACWSAIDRSLEFAAAAIGRLSGKSRPATEYAKRIRFVVRGLKGSLSNASTA